MMRHTALSTGTRRTLDGRFIEGSGDRFLAFRNGSIGNTLVAVPALRALRRAEPGAFIGVVVDAMGYELLRYCPYVDHFFIYEKRGVHHRSVRENLRFVRDLRSFRFSHSLHFKRFRRNGFLAWAAGIPRRVGFETDGKAPFLTVTTPYVEGRNIIDLNLDLVRLLGIDSADLSLELSFSEKEERSVGQFFRDERIPESTAKVALHLGGVSERGWPPEKYAALADRLQTSLSATPIFLRPPPDRAIVDKAIRLTRTSAFVEPTHFTILHRAALIRRCDIFVGNDSGPSHVADAVGTPGVIFYDSKRGLEQHLQKWKPLGEQYVALTTDRSVEECLEACERLVAAALRHRRTRTTATRGDGEARRDRFSGDSQGD